MTYKFLIFFLWFFVCSLHVFGQDSLQNKTNKLDFLNEIDDRKWRVKIPIWVPGFRGNFAYGGITLLPEEEDKDWIDRLEGELGVTFYLIGDVMFKPKKWLFAVDGFHTRLASDLKFQNIDRIGFTAAIDGTILRTYAGYEVFEHHNKETFFKTEIFPYLGIRFIDLHIYSLSSNFVDVQPMWMEPTVGVNAFLNHKRWFFTGMVDVGGFSINNHWSAFANLDASYRFTKLFALGLGWSYLGFNYDSYLDQSYLNLKIALAGPVMNVEFNF